MNKKDDIMSNHRKTAGYEVPRTYSEFSARKNKERKSNVNGNQTINSSLKQRWDREQCNTELQTGGYCDGGSYIKEEMMDSSFPWAKILLVETIAMFVFVSAITITVSNSTDVLTISVVHGFVLMTVIGTFGSEYAGVCNPSVAVLLCGLGILFPNKKWAFLIYLIAEAFGSLLAVLVTYLLTPQLDASLGLGSPTKSNQITAAQGFLSEFLGSFVLYSIIVWTVGLADHYNRKASPCLESPSETRQYTVAPNTMFPIGFCFTVLVITLAPYTGASFNVFRWFFPKLISNTWVEEDWIYFVGPVCGTLAAGIVAWLYIYYWKSRQDFI